MRTNYKAYVLCGLDGTLADTTTRDVEDGNWAAYYNAGFTQPPLPAPTALLMRACADGYGIICCTTRPEKWRTPTTQWAVKYKLPIDEFLMRPEDNYEKAPALKVALALDRFGYGLPGVAAIIDNRPDVLAAFAEWQIPVYPQTRVTEIP